MAFNFNWSPLIADTSRVKELLTSALNRSCKPPIIVDDIIVTELNLGTVPPHLEILEIGDLAVNRFRGIFKFSYAGDAFLTLKTRVQANPLKSYLSTRPSFTSPKPVAAAASLTIPLQITLSDFRLSGFVILVFLRRKGLTLVFRDDPLQSLKVSSTFDSIPFVRDYLQRTIEQQLRFFFMEDLPVILHSLSLRLCSSDPSDHSDDINVPINRHADTQASAGDHLANVNLDSHLDFGFFFDENKFSFDEPSSDSTIQCFSQKNALRLSALSESNRTLSLHPNPISDVVYRAWSGASSYYSSIRYAQNFRNNFSLPPLRLNSAIALSSSNSVSSLSEQEIMSQRSSTNSYNPASTSTGFSSIYSDRPHRKHRVINLRKKPPPSPTCCLSTSLSPQQPDPLKTSISCDPYLTDSFDCTMPISSLLSK